MEVIDSIKRKLDYKNNSQRSKNAILVLYSICILNVLAVISGYFELNLLENFSAGTFVSEEEISSNDLRQMIVGLLQSALFITSSVLFLVWFYRAYQNLHAILGEKKMEMSKSMSVWGFIIPIASLFIPYRITKEITTKNQSILRKIIPEHKNRTKISIINLWWAAFIITNFIQNIAFRTILKSDTIDQMIFSSEAYIISDLIDIPAALITILMIRQISKEESLLFQNVYELENSITSIEQSTEEE